MKTSIILATLSLAGLLIGYGARHLSAGSPSVPGQQVALLPEARAVTSRTPGVSSRLAIVPSTGKSVIPELSIAHSVDTVASILALDPEKNYARIALWTATASEADLAAYWAGYKGGKRSVDVTDLIFLNWTRKNPQAAVSAVAGTQDDRYAWWSWASNDPQAALTASLAAGKGQQEQVACGIGDFNPDWLRAHLSQIPEEFRDDAFNRMKNWPDSQNPLESLNFMKEHGMGFDQETFKSLVRKDPWAALDWLKENPGLGRDRFSSNNETVASLVSILSQERPEDLDRIAAQTPAGETKRLMDQAIFDRLLESHPTVALEQARKHEAPLIAAQRMGKVGLSLVATDPDQAFLIAGEILKANPTQLEILHKIEHPGGSSWSDASGGATELMNALFNKDRDQVLKLMAANCGDQVMPETLSAFSSRWAGSDLVGFTEWANQQTGVLRGVAARQISNKLASQGNYVEAIEWAGSGTQGPENAYSNVLYQWHKTDATAAAAWVENSDLSAEHKKKYRSLLKDKF